MINALQIFLRTALTSRTTATTGITAAHPLIIGHRLNRIDRAHYPAVADQGPVGIISTANPVFINMNSTRGKGDNLLVTQSLAQLNNRFAIFFPMGFQHTVVFVIQVHSVKPVTVNNLLGRGDKIINMGGICQTTPLGTLAAKSQYHTDTVLLQRTNILLECLYITVISTGIQIKADIPLLIQQTE